LTICIALLRGINVSGQKPVPMADLQKLFESLGFKGAKTLIQTGNVVFRSDKAKPDAAALAGLLEKAIEKRFGFEVAVLLRTLEEFRAVLDANPWRKKKLAETERVYISFLDKAPAKEGIQALAAVPAGEDEHIVRNSEVYLLIRGGYGKSKLSNSVVEKKLKARSTTRNLETSEKLLALAEGQA
jgi:uncharacterized protein (DUF1697 family)